MEIGTRTSDNGIINDKKQPNKRARRDGNAKDFSCSLLARGKLGCRDKVASPVQGGSL